MMGFMRMPALIALAAGAFLTGALAASALQTSPGPQKAAASPRTLAEPSFPVPVAGEPALAGAEALISRIGYALLETEHETLESGAELYRYAFGAPGTPQGGPAVWKLDAEVNQAVLTALNFSFPRPAAGGAAQPWAFGSTEERLVLDVLRVTVPGSSPAMIQAEMAQGVGQLCPSAPEQKPPALRQGRWSVFACHTSDELRAWITRPLPPIEFRSLP